jgi:hypothetical protein
MPEPTLYLTWEDDFNRVDSPPLAGPYVADWDDGPWAAMDGSVLVGPPVGESFGYVGWPEAVYGRIQYDFLIAEGSYYEIECSGADALDLWIWDDGDGLWLAGSNGLPDVPFYPTPGEWWTVKGDVHPAFARIKVWKRGDPEPDWGYEGAPFYHASYSQYLEIDSGTAVGKIDNFFLWESLPGPPPITLTDSLWEAPDMYPALRANGGLAWTGVVDTSAFGTDVNDPDVSIFRTAAKGEFTAWAKVVLPSRATLDFDATLTDYQSGMLIYQQDEAGALTLVHSWTPWVTKTMSLPNNGVARTLNHPVITAGSGAMPTGIPGVTHTMMQSRTYVLFDWYLPGGWGQAGDFWQNTQPWVEFDVWVSGQNVGYAKSLIVKLQYEHYIDGSWVDAGVAVNVSSIFLDSRSGHSYRAQMPIADPYAGWLGAGQHLGHYRLVVLETGNGGEIWTDYATVTMRGAWVDWDTFRAQTPRIVTDLDPGTYLVCLTAIDSDNTFVPFSGGDASLIVRMTHPVRTDG